MVILVIVRAIKVINRVIRHIRDIRVSIRTSKVVGVILVVNSNSNIQFRF